MEKKHQKLIVVAGLGFAQAKVGSLSETFGVQQTNTDIQTNTHFFLNSIAAFEDVLSYIYIDTDQWIQKLN